MTVPLGTGKLHDWEDVTHSVTRLCVNGGWVYRFWEDEAPPAFVFVPDYEENIAGIREDPALARLIELLEDENLGKLGGRPTGEGTPPATGG